MEHGSNAALQERSDVNKSTKELLKELERGPVVVHPLGEKNRLNAARELASLSGIFKLEEFGDSFRLTCLGHGRTVWV